MIQYSILIIVPKPSIQIAYLWLENQIHFTWSKFCTGSEELMDFGKAAFTKEE